MVEISLLQRADQDALGAVNGLIAQMGLTNVPPKPMSLRYFQSLLAQQDFHFLVAQAASGGRKKIVGALSLCFAKIPTGLLAWVEDLIVDAPYRKWGVGRLLVERAIGIAKERQARHISLRTNPKRIEANKLYRALGFQKMETNFYRINLFK